MNRIGIVVLSAFLLVLIQASPAAAKIEVGAGFIYSFMNSAGGLDLEPGPGVQVTLGWQGDIFGVRGDFMYANMEVKPGFVANGDENANLWGGGVDLKVRPLGKVDFPLQPYALAGLGFQVVDTNVAARYGLVSDTMGPQGRLGLGLEMLFGDYFTVGIEGEWKPCACFADGNDSDIDGEWVQFFTAGINVGARF